MDAVRLLRKTTKIESTLENAGGSGGGIWEKADCISNKLPKDFMKRIITIATVRNDAVHGDLQVKNIDTVVKECTKVLEILEVNDKLKKINMIITKKLNILDNSEVLKFSEELSKWVTNIQRFNMNKNTKFQALLEDEPRMLKELNSFVIKKRLKSVVILAGMGLIIAFIYITFRINT